MEIDKNTPIITLHQPWCFWIAFGWKTIETRLHSRFKNLKGKRIGIHAGKKYDYEALDVAKNYIDQRRLELSKFFINDGGYIVCTAFVNDFKKCSEQDTIQAWVDCKNTERWGLYLTDIEKNENFKYGFHRGKRGIWYIK